MNEWNQNYKPFLCHTTENYFVKWLKVDLDSIWAWTKVSGPPHAILTFSMSSSVL